MATSSSTSEFLLNHRQWSDPNLLKQFLSSNITTNNINLSALALLQNEIKEEVRAIVITHQNQLINQTNNISLLQSELVKIQQKISNLISSMNKVESALYEPFKLLQKQVNIANNINNT